ncbi:hypothetical protein [Marinifilum flexuosum]|uniref:hypothetical protein n=1 Tax=Marinifilum flexuosum TaxID=1117708 RepID=UPI0024903246|nr:hypothetical protein [Marinifilum flexuosum]
MSVIKQNFKQYLRGLNIIHGALLFGQITFAGITIFITQMNGATAPDAELEDIFFILVPIFFIGCFLASQIIVPKRLEASRKEKDLNSKLGVYRSTQIIKLAMIEGAAFFAIIANLLFANFLFIGFAVLLMCLFATYFPTKEKLIRELELNRDEQNLLDDANAIVFEYSPQ